MTTKRGSTAHAELVQTHKLALALQRLREAPYDNGKWKRALYHALSMTSTYDDRTQLEAIRVALRLP